MMHPSGNDYQGGKSTNNKVTNTLHPSKIGIASGQGIAVSDTMQPSFILTHYDTKGRK